MGLEAAACLGLNLASADVGSYLAADKPLTARVELGRGFAYNMQPRTRPPALLHSVPHLLARMHVQST